MSKKNILIPKLRFPEFLTEGKWEVKELKELGDLINGLTYSPDDVRDKGLLVLRSSNIQNGLIDFNDTVYVRTDIKGFKLSKPKDILVCVRNGSKNLIGKNAMIPKGIPLATHGAFMTMFRAKNAEFVFQLFQTDFYDSQVKADLGATINSINGKNLLKYEFPIPTNPKEQQKIASCLSTLDEVITGHSKKLEVLKDHKKALIQSLFPQKNEKVPKYRFAEFKNDGNWEVKTLENYIDLLSGIALKGEDLSTDKSGIPILRGINITEGHIRHSADIDKFFLNKSENLDKYLVKENDIVVGMDGSKVGKNVALVKKCDENSILIQRVARIRTNKKADVKYVYHHFISEKFRGYVDTVNTSSGIPHISAQQIKDFKIAFPPKLQEQQKIASCLSDLDALIIVQMDKIEQLKLHKKGLMQELFPKINY